MDQASATIYQLEQGRCESFTQPLMPPSMKVPVRVRLNLRGKLPRIEVAMGRGLSPYFALSPRLASGEWIPTFVQGEIQEIKIQPDVESIKTSAGDGKALGFRLDDENDVVPTPVTQ